MSLLQPVISNQVTRWHFSTRTAWICHGCEAVGWHDSTVARCLDLLLTVRSSLTQSESHVSLRHFFVLHDTCPLITRLGIESKMTKLEKDDTQAGNRNSDHNNYDLDDGLRHFTAFRMGTACGMVLRQSYCVQKALAVALC